jgi:hypothetical protein
MVVLLLFSALIFLPVDESGADFLRLAFLRATSEQDHQTLAVLAKIDPVTWAEIDPLFEQAGSDAFNVREVAAREPGQRRRDFGRRLRIEAIKPNSIWAPPFWIDVFANVDHSIQ